MQLLGEAIMLAITVKNIPNELYKTIKQTAIQHHRSINKEIIYSLEKVMNNSLNDVDEIKHSAQMFREKTKKMYLTEKILNQAKEFGRK